MKRRRMVMLEKLLSEKKSIILRKWFEIILATYPDDTQGFLRGQKNPFSNPVGQTISKGIEALFEGLLHGPDLENTSTFLDQVVRIRAVQDFTPSQAIAFIFRLKSVIRAELRGALHREEVLEDLAVLESRIDDLGLLAFDVYVKCRERLYEIRANEMRRSTVRLLKKTDLFYDLEGQGPGSEDVEYDNSE